MATTNRTRHPTASANGSASFESIVATVRALWNAVEGANEPQQAKLKREISQTVNRLKSRVEVRLGSPVLSAPKERLLFEKAEDQSAMEMRVAVPPAPARFIEPVLRVYAKDFADHALQHLPQAMKYHSVEEFRRYLTQKLRFNSVPTRRRAANYILSRFFPGEAYNDDLPQFAAATAGKPALGEALFYLTCRTEKIVSMVAEEIVFPSLAQGGVNRTRLREYIQAKFPN